MSRRRPDPPTHLDDAARAKWLELLPALPDEQPATLDVFATYCAAWSRMMQAEQQIRSVGVVRKGMSGTKLSPWYAVLQAERRAVRQLANELRLTPKARARRKDAASQDPILQLIRNQ